ncbi:MAG: hypothetical protein P0Y64_16635 [Candidatus Sphingomonas colombiensis]|nr:hypothetical protein [Sphingomonas sp.]WEK42946.1 MAG: hypothetical protein P0Y64_16635 [Sphingomonas sp.]
MICVTHNAAARYVERVNPRLTLDEAIAAIRQHSRIIEIAIRERAPIVKLGTGQKLVIVGDAIVTVLPRGAINWSGM